MSNQLPAQVLRDLEEAERIQNALTVDPVTEPEEPAPSEEQPPAQPVQETPPPPLPPAEEDTWKARYQTLKGKYDHEVPALTQQVRDLTARVDALSTAPPPEPPAPKPTPSLTQKDIEDYGPELIEVIKRAAHDVAGDEIARLTAEIDSLKAKADTAVQAVEQVQTAHTQTRSDKFLAEINAAIPDIVAINSDPRFLAWLGETDPLSGEVRQMWVNTAQDQFDSARIIKLVNHWKTTVGWGQPPAPPAPPPANPVAEELASQTQPGRPRSQTPAADASRKVFTQAEVAEFYTAVAKGEYRGREAEMAAREAEIDLAAAEGRVR